MDNILLCVVFAEKHRFIVEVIRFISILNINLWKSFRKSPYAAQKNIEAAERRATRCLLRRLLGLLISMLAQSGQRYQRYKT